MSESREHPIYAGFDAVDPDNPVVAVISDTQGKSPFEPWQERNEPARDALLAEIARRRPAFLLHLGDLVALGGSDRCWTELDGALSPVHQAEVPILPVLGNHDYMGSRERLERNRRARFGHVAEPRWFDVLHAGVAWIALDSNFRALGSEAVEAQQRWLEKRLAEYGEDPSVRGVILGCHHPPMTNSWVVASNRTVRRRFVRPFLACRKAMAFFSGHCHAYEHFVREGRHFFVTGGGGGPRQRLHRYRPFRRWNDLFPGESKRFLHFCEVAAGESGLVVRVIPAGSTEPIDETRIDWPE